jgi:putative ABC transport system permease protein
MSGRHRPRVGWMWRLLPREVRERYGEDMTSVLNERLAEERTNAGRLGALRYRLRIVSDILGTATRTWSDVLRRRTIKPVPPRRQRSSTGGMIGQDLRYGIRVFVRSPLFSTMAALTLALGIGATTAVFGLVDAVILRPLEMPESGRVVQIWDRYPSATGATDDLVAVPNYRNYREQNQVFERLAALQSGQFFLEGVDGIETISALFASPDFLPLVGVDPVLGHGFRSEQEDDDATPVAIVTHEFWRQRMGGTAEALGRMLTLWRWGTRGLVSAEFTVVGILPEDFQLPPLKHRDGFGPLPSPQVLVPTGLWSLDKNDRSRRAFSVLARLEEGVTIERAQANMDAIAAGIAVEYPETNRGYSTVVASLSQLIRRQYGTRLYLLWGAAVFVLLIACVNVANLVLGQAVTRDREFAVRSILGAGPVRLVRQLLTESVLLALLGGTGGLLLALWGTRVLVAAVPGDVYRLHEVGVDLRVLGFLMGGSLLTAMLFGLLPAFRSARPNLSEVLGEGGRGLLGGRLHSLRVLVVAELAMALMLLIGVGLMLRTFRNLTSVDPGFERENVLALTVRMLPYQLSKYKSLHERAPLFDRVEERVTSLPGVVSVAVIGDLPMTGSEWEWDITLADRPPPPPDERIRVDFREVSDGYFETMGIPVLAGRTFTDVDTQQMLAWWRFRNQQPEMNPQEVARRSSQFTLPVIVNETMAQQFWPGVSALGKVLYWGIVDPDRVSEPAEWDMRYDPPSLLSVVGVVREVKTLGLDQEPRLQVYIPAPKKLGWLVVRTESDPLAEAETVRYAIEAVDPELSVTNVSTMEARFSAAVAQERLRMLLIGLFAALAVLLATVGLFGVTAHLVNQRTHEIGVRMALGARPNDIMRVVGGQGLRLIVLGTVIGLVGALALTRFVSSLLFGVTPTDPVSYIGSVVVLSSVAMVACYLPTRRAFKMDPAEVLRSE